MGKRLIIQYTHKNWSEKWTKFNCLEEQNYNTYKSIEEYGCNARNIFTKVTDIAFGIMKMVILKLVNSLESFSSIYFTILNKRTRTDKAFPKIDKLLKNFENEKFGIKQEYVNVTNFGSRTKKVQD